MNSTVIRFAKAHCRKLKDAYVPVGYTYTQYLESCDMHNEPYLSFEKFIDIMQELGYSIKNNVFVDFEVDNLYD